jgi:hypothetical protein
LLAADGFLLPPLMHRNVAVPVALSVIVWTEPEGRPVSLKLTTRLSPTRVTSVAFLLNCGFPPPASPRARPGAPPAVGAVVSVEQAAAARSRAADRSVRA